MASGDSTRLPAYLLGEWPGKFRHALLTPATRWRVFIEDQERIEPDIILNTVLRIRQAGERDASRIADLLQLPEDLIRHLLATADRERLEAAKSGQSIVALRSTVGWVYRDAATGELWPEPGEQIEPLEIRYSGSFRGRFNTGTAGRRTPIDALLLDTYETGDLRPTANELARFSWSDDAQKRTAVISSGEPCLVVSPATKDKSGLAVLTTQDSPQLSLGRLLNSAVDRYESVAKWARGVPLSAEKAQRSPLELALVELSDTLGFLRVGEFRTVSPARLTGLIDLILGRWVDEYRYQSGLAAVIESPTDEQSRAVAERFTLSPTIAQRWAAGPRSDCRRKVLELLATRLYSGDPRLGELSVAAARYDSIVGSGSPSQEVVDLAQQIVNVGQLLLNREEGGHVQGES
ncbi:hypothetical protein QM806_39920 [Rhodococcus sp. IEGM 1351]|uniref:hypothetical protein n=1 Tax=Rhodococcus sp. IEGM 1351 TaxID=3047089 RepID=UPI0024B845B3|nr:hypothetical protein [Rhodococcus sp. IEGM 1351]MDI9941514.1 hypothetical protein [Rhodococcus sp. IEGM 1351]